MAELLAAQWWMKAQNEHDLVAMKEYMSPDFVFVVEDGQLDGVQPFLDVVQDIFDAFPDFQWHAASTTVDGNQVTMELKASMALTLELLIVSACSPRLKPRELPPRMTPRHRSFMLKVARSRQSRSLVTVPAADLLEFTFRLEERWNECATFDKERNKMRIKNFFYSNNRCCIVSLIIHLNRSWFQILLFQDRKPCKSRAKLLVSRSSTYTLFNLPSVWHRFQPLDGVSIEEGPIWNANLIRESKCEYIIVES